MKSINFYKSLLVTAALAFGIMSCDDSSEFVTFNQPYVAFEQPTVSVSEATATTSADGVTIKTGTVHNIELRRSSTNLDEPLTVNLSVEAKYLTDNEFVNAGDDASDAVRIPGDISSVTFEPGEVRKSFELITFDDDLSSGDKMVTVTITSVSNDKYSIGYEPATFSATTEIVVVDDDCPVDIESFAGEYQVDAFTRPRDGLNLCRFMTTCGDLMTVTVNDSDPTGTSLILTSSTFTDPLLLQFQTCPQTVTIENETTFSVQSGLNPYSWLQATSGGEINPGSYNPEGLKMLIRGGLASSGNLYELEISKIN